MREKETLPKTGCDDKTAGGMAAVSVARYFKGNRWKIISFFPNASCAARAAEDKKADAPKKKRSKSK